MELYFCCAISLCNMVHNKYREDFAVVITYTVMLLPLLYYNVLALIVYPENSYLELQLQR
jgi:hypothetical protein